MAVAYLNDGAVSLAAANWSDGVGFADNADLRIGAGGQSITSDLSFTALGGGNEAIDYLRVARPFSGVIGSLNTPLKVDCDGQIEFAGTGTMYYDAEGDDNICASFLLSGPGSVSLVGGTIAELIVEQGSLLVDTNTAVTNAYISGGRGTIEDHASSSFTTCVITGGTWEVYRPGTYIVGGSASVIFDIDGGTTSLTQSGGIVTLRRGTISTSNLYAGAMEARGIERAATMGASGGIIMPGFRLNKTADLTVSATYKGSQTQAQGSIVPGF